MNTTKPVAIAGVLLLVWFGTYWLWEPSSKAGPRITMSPTPLPTAAIEQRPVTAPNGLSAADRTSGPSGGIQIPDPLLSTGKTIAEPTKDTAVAAESKPRVTPPQFNDYTIQKGDVSFEAIARRFGGGAKLAEAIKKSNPFVTPNKLIVGRTVLRIPVDPDNIQGKLESSASSKSGTKSGPTVAPPAPGAFHPMEELSHKVLPGETLTSIAPKYYSYPAGWMKIYNANRDQLSAPDKLKAGMILRIPPGAT